MAKLGVTLACGNYDRTRALAQGIVQPDGIDLNFVPFDKPSGIFRRMIDHAEFDASELSLSNYLMGVSRGDTRFVGIPVFTYRAFRHSMLWVNSSSGIKEPRDLAGARVGVPEYAVTAVLFLRGMLFHEYGVTAESVKWVRGRTERVALSLPPTIELEDAPRNVSLDAMFASGQLDALASFSTPRPADPAEPPAHRLFPDVRATEGDYFRRTRIFPIMHLIVIRRDIYERNRWMAVSLMQAFEASKQRVLEVAEHDYFAVSTSLTPWLRIAAEEAREVFGAELYPYGLEQNRPTLEAATQYSFEQHLSARLLALDDGELFAPETIDGVSTTL